MSTVGVKRKRGRPRKNPLPPPYPDRTFAAGDMSIYQPQPTDGAHAPPHTHHTSLDHDPELNALVYQTQSPANYVPSSPYAKPKRSHYYLGWLASFLLLAILVLIILIILDKTGVIDLREIFGRKKGGESSESPGSGSGSVSVSGSPTSTVPGGAASGSASGSSSGSAPGSVGPGSSSAGTSVVSDSASDSINELSDRQLITSVLALTLSTLSLVGLFAYGMRSQFAFALYICGIICVSLALPIQNEEVTWTGVSILFSAVVWMVISKTVADADYYFRDLFILLVGVAITTVGVIAVRQERSAERMAIAIILVVFGVLMILNGARMVFRRRFFGGPLTKEGYKSVMKKVLEASEEVVDNGKGLTEAEKASFMDVVEGFFERHHLNTTQSFSFRKSARHFGAREFQKEANDILTEAENLLKKGREKAEKETEDLERKVTAVRNRLENVMNDGENEGERFFQGGLVAWLFGWMDR